MYVLVARYRTRTNTRQIDYFSSRFVRDNEGSPTGTANHDNARVFNERARRHSQVGRENLDCNGNVIGGGGGSGGINNCRNAYGDDNACDDWRAQGFCTGRFGAWMAANCARACAANAHGDDEDCEDWLNRGYCAANSRYAQWMAANCAKACGTC